MTAVRHPAESRRPAGIRHTQSLRDAIAAAGMTPPACIPQGRFVRFPGVGKRRGNTAGWCKLITPTLAVFGDWSTGLTAVWRDASHRDDAQTRAALERAREEARRLAAEERARQEQVAAQAAQIVRAAVLSTHPYLARKGFPHMSALVHEGKLVVPVRDAESYERVMSAQLIDEDGTKKFLPGGRTKGGIYRLGQPPARARYVLLCEGYATALSIDAAMARLSPSRAVIACFSARNVEFVARRFPRAIVCADNDASRTGEEAARRTGLRWCMPPEVGQDFNDLHVRHGLTAVVEVLRGVITRAPPGHCGD